MKHLTIVVMATALLSPAVHSCKTSESNYRTAYEQAVTRRQENGNDDTVYNNIRRQATTSTRVVAGDTIKVRRERVKLAEPADGETLAEAYAIAAQFKQVFNARSLRDRLRAAGYSGATLLVTREPLYYVAAGSGTPGDMKSLCDTLSGAGAIAVRPPYPLVLEPVR